MSRLANFLTRFLKKNRFSGESLKNQVNKIPMQIKKIDFTKSPSQ